MKVLRTATIFAAVLVCAPAHAQFVVGVNPVDGATFMALLGQPNGQSPLPSDAPSPDTMNDRLSQLVGLGYFPAVGQTPDMTSEELGQMLAAYVGAGDASSFPDAPQWAAGFVGGTPPVDSTQPPDDIEAYLRKTLGLDANHQSSEFSALVSAAPTPAQLAQERARKLAEEKQRREILEQQKSQAEAAARARLEAQLQAQRNQQAALEQRRQALAAAGMDRFQNTQFSAPQTSGPDTRGDMLRSADYRGTAHSSEYDDFSVTGDVALRIDLDKNTLSGQFDFGSTGMLYVSGMFDDVGLNLHLDQGKRSTFGGYQLDDAFFHEDSFFATNGAEINGGWGFENPHVQAGGEFAATRVSP